ncbi:MAG: RdgB/HAM1 family non-canonical purine NTP pyrophosphatase [Bacteroidales bacterium]|nr:RdgB/HAM1 family non-canonical purine NTP pyrophosphatase [Candidatus Cacconaster merdequi]
MEIIFATNNAHKAAETEGILGSSFRIITPSSLGFNGDIPETHDTIRENSIQKAQFIWDKFHRTCFADDTGLMVDALKGAPGVYSARYAGEQKDFAANRRKVLEGLEGVPYEKRTARFLCVVSLIEDGNLTVFEGTCEGHIALSEHDGLQGFGYDSIFIPEGLQVTMSEVSMEQKSAISHRGAAMRALKCHLEKNQG